MLITTPCAYLNSLFFSFFFHLEDWKVKRAENFWHAKRENVSTEFLHFFLCVSVHECKSLGVGEATSYELRHSEQ